MLFFQALGRAQRKCLQGPGCSKADTRLDTEQFRRRASRRACRGGRAYRRCRPNRINASQMNDEGYVRKRAWQYLPPELSRWVRSISPLIFFSTVSAQPSRPTDAQWLRRWPTGLAVVATNRGGYAEVNDPGVRLPDSNAGAGLRCRTSFTSRPRQVLSHGRSSDAETGE